MLEICVKTVGSQIVISNGDFLENDDVRVVVVSPDQVDLLIEWLNEAKKEAIENDDDYAANRKAADWVEDNIKNIQKKPDQ